MKVLLVEPMQLPRAVEIDCSLDAMYRILDCRTITAVYPWEDPVALVTDDEGMLRAKVPNRYIPQLRQPIFGSFFLCGIGEEDFTDLPDELLEKYAEYFGKRELIDADEFGIRVVAME